MITVNLEKYLDKDTSYLYGKEKGEKIRKELRLDEIDGKDEKIEFFVSKEMSGINLACFVALFKKSIKKLSESKFREKYLFKYENEDIEKLVEFDVEAGIEESILERIHFEF